MKKLILNIIAVIVAFVAAISCHQTKNVGTINGTHDEVEIDKIGSCLHDKKQRDAVFSAMHDTLYRYPCEISDTNYTIPFSVRYVYERAFLSCKNLKEVIIPSTVWEIEMATFDGCSDLERVFLYAQLNTMPFRFLNGCENLKEIHVASEVPPIIEKHEDNEEFNFRIVLGNANLDSLTLYVPNEAINEYKKAYGWRLFKHIEPEFHVQDSLSRFAHIKQCIIKGDAHQFASLVSNYPFPRRYPLKDIENKEQMIAYFNIMFDNRIKDMLRHSTDEDWGNGGWRGHAFKDGLIWVYGGLITSVNYISAKENALYENTIKEDIASLHKTLQKKGIKPHRCFSDMVDGSILRIDQDGEEYRFTLWSKGKSLSGLPDVCAYGTREIQGSMANEYYSFIVRKTIYEVFFGLESPILRVSVSGKIEEHELKECYWLDLI